MSTTTALPEVNMGQYVVLGENVSLGPGVRLGHHAVIGDNVSLGEGVVIGAGAIIGYREKLDGEAPPTEIGAHATVRSGSIIYAGSRIGARTTVGHNCVVREHTTVGHDTYIGSLASVESETIIGDYVGIQSHCYITRNCRVGDYTFIGPGFAEANDNAMTHRRHGHGNNLVGFTTERYVRIAIGVVALPGVHFGEGCIVGAGSVVTRDVPPYTVVMGIPARVVRAAPHELPVGAEEEPCTKES